MIFKLNYSALLLGALLTAFSHSSGANEEVILQQQCSKGDLPSCESLNAFFIKTSQWDNAITLGEALCKKELMKGCTFAGTAMLAKGKGKEGLSYLTKSCDGFESYACRSLSRIMKQNKEDLSAYMFSKRACHYGLTESCSSLKTPKDTYSAKGKAFLKKVFEDCEDSKFSGCQSALASLQKCSEILSANDCLLIPGELSIHFRAKLLQESAKLVLMNVNALQKTTFEKTKPSRYSYDLKALLKDQKPGRAYHYVFGFKKACTKKFENTRHAESTSLALYDDAYSHVSSRSKKNISAFFYQGKAEDCYDPKFGHEAFAVGNLDPQNPARLDIWKTNRDGNLVHLQNGLPLP